jgi:hypothetical protein
MNSILVVKVLLYHDSAAELVIPIVVNSVIFNICETINMQLLIHCHSIFRSVELERNVRQFESLQVCAL